MWKVKIACVLRWEVASIEITLLGVAHPIREKYFKCGTCTDGVKILGNRKIRRDILEKFLSLIPSVSTIHIISQII